MQAAMNPSLSFSLDERTVAALLQEDESTFNMLGSLLPSAASAALAAAEGQHGNQSALQAANAAAMHHLLQLHAGQVGFSRLPACVSDLQKSDSAAYKLDHLILALMRIM
jgi:ABC-type transporter Mla subunit MlaD